VGEATALRRFDLDLQAATVGVRAAYVERSTAEMLLGPPRSKAGRRIAGLSCLACYGISSSEDICLVRECPPQTVPDRAIGHAAGTLAWGLTRQTKAVKRVARNC
jgi:hypothetical protein